MGFWLGVTVPGDLRTDDYCGVPVLIARARRQTARVLQGLPAQRRQSGRGCGKARMFACPYHA
jgi:hypothetical protein